MKNVHDNRKIEHDWTEAKSREILRNTCYHILNQFTIFKKKIVISWFDTQTLSLEFFFEIGLLAICSIEFFSEDIFTKKGNFQKEFMSRTSIEALLYLP